MSLPSSAPHVGARVKVATRGGGTVWGRVTFVTSDIKGGRPGIDYTTDAGDSHWCYLTQVLSSTNSNI